MKLRTFVLACSIGMAFHGCMDLAVFLLNNYHAPSWTLGVAWLFNAVLLYLLSRLV